MPIPNNIASGVVNEARGASAAATVLGEAERFSAIGTVGKVAGAASTAAMVVPMAGGILGWLGKKAAPFKPAITTVAGEASTLLGTAGSATTAAGKSGLFSTLGRWFGKTADPLNIAAKAAQLPNLAVGELRGGVSKVMHEAAAVAANSGMKGTNAAIRSASVLTQKGIHNTVRYAQATLGPKMGGYLKNATTSTAIFAGAGMVTEGASMALNLKSRIATLKAMQADLTGKVPSTFSVMFGSKDLHPIVAQSRKQVMTGRALLSFGIQAVGMVGNAALMFTGNKGGSMMKYMLKSMAFSMGTSMLAKAVSNDDMLTAYRQMTQSFATTGKAGPETYAALIGGLAPKASEKVVMEVAQRAYAKQLAPKEVLKLVSETSLFKPEAAAAATKNAIVGSHTARLAVNKAADRGMDAAVVGA